MLCSGSAAGVRGYRAHALRPDSRRGRRSLIGDSALGLALFWLEGTSRGHVASAEEVCPSRVLQPTEWPPAPVSTSCGDEPTVIYLMPGEVYRGQIVVGEGQKVVIKVGDGRGSATLEHFTSAPYEPVMRVLGSCVVEGDIRITHASPSVASNFAVGVGRDASLRIVGATITSSTGSGVCVEGGTCDLDSVRIVDCKEHGLAFYQDIESGQGSVVSVRGGTEIAGCSGFGVQARGDDVRVSISQTASLRNNKLGRYSNQLQGAEISEV